MTRVLIIYRVDKNNPQNTGVVKKLIGQVEGLEQSSCNVDYVIHDKQRIYINNKLIYKSKSDGVLFKWNYFNYINSSALGRYDICLIRYGLTTLPLINFLKNFRENNLNAKMLLDMPTYPYRQEHFGFSGKVKILIDGLLSKRLKRDVDYVLHSGFETSIFGIPTIRISNGISCDRIKLKRPKGELHYKMIAVGKWRKWHGLDRLIAGMSIYREESTLKLDVVGDGPELTNLKLLTKEKGLEDRVIFHGVCVGDKLDKLFDEADIGVGTLGLFRKGVTVDSSLKNREYIARGLSVILSSEDADIKSDLNFVCKVPEDESAIDVRFVERYIEDVNMSDTINETRTFAENHLSWRSKMKTLLTELERLK